MNCMLFIVHRLIISVFVLQIWEAVDPRQEGYVSRDGLYKALALTALAQQGKPVTEKALETFVDSGINLITTFLCQ